MLTVSDMLNISQYAQYCNNKKAKTTINLLVTFHIMSNKIDKIIDQLF